MSNTGNKNNKKYSATADSAASKIILGGTGDMGLGVKNLADSINFEVVIKPMTVEGKSLSFEQLNKLRVGSGLGQHPSVSYGTSGSSKRKRSKKKPSKANANKDAA